MKNTIVSTAIIAGLLSGISAVKAEDAKHEAAPAKAHKKAAHGKKDKDSCHTKKEKNSCNGKNGCGSEKKATEEKAVETK
jgi:hypothetical protein